jgi:uncharacterized protein YndB with AHSA1/START domain
MSEQASDITPVRKTVTVPIPPQRAFELFTARFGEWWPLATHSVGADQAVGVVFGAGAGASIVETLADGSTSAWGTITRWDPPHGVAFSWHAGTPPEEATSVKVTFSAGEPGHTVVELVHCGWHHRPDGAAARDGYEAGWNPVIGHYARLAVTSGLPASTR